MIRKADELPAELTVQQAKILDFIRQQIAEEHGPPSRREICRHFGFASNTGANCHLRALERKGYITCDPGSARGIKLTEDTTGVPVMGTVQAGVLTDHGSDFEPEFFDFRSLWQPGDYMLHVTGNSMVGIGLLDGDWAVVRPCERAPVGSIVVVDQPGEGQTIKTLWADDEGPILEPSNPDMKAIRPGEDAKIIGFVVSSGRQYTQRRH